MVEGVAGCVEPRSMFLGRAPLSGIMETHESAVPDIMKSWKGHVPAKRKRQEKMGVQISIGHQPGGLMSCCT